MQHADLLLAALLFAVAVLYCPGPGLANLAHGGEAVAFVAALLAGSQLARLVPAR